MSALTDGAEDSGARGDAPEALAATFGPKLGLLPEMARVVVRFAFHCGYY